MEPNVCIFVLVGIPGAGKTSFCRRLLEAKQSSFKIVHICYDDLFKIQQFTDNSEFLYKSQREDFVKIIEGIAKAAADSQVIPAHLKEKVHISTNNASAHIILIDDNHYYRSMRYKVFQLCKLQGYGYAQIYFESSLQLALERNAQRDLNDRLPEHVLSRMVERLEAPLFSNNWEKFTLTFQATDCDIPVDDVFPMAAKALEGLFVNQIIDNEICKEEQASLLHILDIRLRCRISEILGTIDSKEDKKLRAINLNNERKKILHQKRENSDLDEMKLDDVVLLLN